MGNKTDRKVTVPWDDLAAILRKSDTMMTNEEIREITLTKPKQILFYLRKKTEAWLG